MQIGFLTACLADVRLEDLVPWAAAQGFEALELAAWPHKAEREYQPRHIDAAAFTEDDAERVHALLAEYDLHVSAMAYYDNNLHPDLTKRNAYHDHLGHLIDAAALLGVDRVGTFVGARNDCSPKENMKEIGAVFREIVKYAEDRGVRILIENCPMENWVQFGLPGNYAYSPELWEALFNEVPSANLGLNFDPSHLYWLGIDYHRAAREFADRIYHVHAKDAEILEEGTYRYGVLGRQLGDNVWQSGRWRYRMPGNGAIDWAAFIETLQAIGYDDVLSIEHEDPDYEGSEEAVKEGLRLGLEHLKECRVTKAV